MKKDKYEMWEPIIETLLKYNDNNYSQKNRRFMAEYADHHSQKENQFVESTTIKSTLAISLKLLSMLNLDDIELNIIDLKTPKIKIVEDGIGLQLETEDNSVYENFEINISITKDQIVDLGVGGIDFMNRIEHLLLEENAKQINRKLETSKELNIYMMVNNINMSDIIDHGNGVKEKLKNPKISISNMIKFD